MKHPIKCRMENINLRRFIPEEFRGWKMSPELLVKLDLLAVRWREYSGKGITVSSVLGAIGRDGKGSSQHFWENWGEVRAIDIFPGISYAQTNAFEQAAKFAEFATECGFTGIGVYPDANPSLLFHVDVRDSADPLYPSAWGAVRSKDPNTTWDYISFEDAMEQL